MPDVSVDILTQSTPPAPAKLPLGRAATPRQRFANRLVAGWQEASFNADSSRCTLMHADKGCPNEPSGKIFSRALTELETAPLDSAEPPSATAAGASTVRTMDPAPPVGGHDARVHRLPAVRVSTSRRSTAMPKTGWRWACPSNSVSAQFQCRQRVDSGPSGRVRQRSGSATSGWPLRTLRIGMGVRSGWAPVVPPYPRQRESGTGQTARQRAAPGATPPESRGCRSARLTPPDQPKAKQRRGQE